MKYSYHESYKHKLAKELLFGWLTEIDKENDFCHFHGLTWRSNYGVFMELPFHETDDPYYWELSKGLFEYKSYKSPTGFDPSYDRGQILFVPDITIFHKGTAKILIEVVHKSPVSKCKLAVIKKFFSTGYVELYEIEAENILSQTNKNVDLRFRKIDTDFIISTEKQIKTPEGLKAIREKYKGLL